MSLRGHTHCRIEPAYEERSVDLGPWTVGWVVRGQLSLAIVFQMELETPKFEHNI